MSNDKDNINSLRSILFDTMRGIKDGSIDVEKAKTISDIGQVIINSAKVEVDAMRATGSEGSGFIPAALPDPKKPGVITHRCK